MECDMNMAVVGKHSVGPSDYGKLKNDVKAKVSGPVSFKSSGSVIGK